MEWERELLGFPVNAQEMRLARDFPVPVDTLINHGPVFRETQSFINERLNDMPDEEPPLICEGCGDSSTADETVVERSDLGIRCGCCNSQCDRCGTDMKDYYGWRARIGLIYMKKAPTISQVVAHRCWPHG